MQPNSYTMRCTAAHIGTAIPAHISSSLQVKKQITVIQGVAHRQCHHHSNSTFPHDSIRKATWARSVSRNAKWPTETLSGTASVKSGQRKPVSWKRPMAPLSPPQRQQRPCKGTKRLRQRQTCETHQRCLWLVRLESFEETNS